MLRVLKPAIFALCVAPAAQAQVVQCADHEEMRQHLADNWGESRRSVALDAGRSLVEIYASDVTGTWTLVVTRPGGPSCLVASGSDYEAIEDPLPGKGEGA